MSALKIAILILLALLCVCSAYCQSPKRSKIVVMVIPDPTIYKAERTDTVLNAAFNAINSYLIENEISVIDKYYVELALKELREKRDLDIAAASIEYGKKNMADKVIWFQITDKSASYSDKRYVCELKVISVRTGQINAIVSETGSDREDNEKAAASAAIKATAAAIARINTREELYTVTFIGELSLREQERLDSIFDKMQGVQSFDGYSVGVNKYEYRISYLDMIRTLRNNINIAAGDMGIKLRQQEGTVNSLTFYMLPKPNIHNSLSKISGYGSLVCAGAGGFTYYMAYRSYQKYKDATNTTDMLMHKQDFQTYDDYTLVAGIGAGTLLTWYIIERSIIKSQRKVKAVDFGLYLPDPETIGVSILFPW